MKLLHIDSSILGENSVSRSLSKATVQQLKAEIPGLDVTYRDLVAEPITHLSGRDLPTAGSDPALEEFLAADIVVIGVALYNFTISSQLKAWIDRVLVAGKTFRYGEKGPEGLAGNKRVILTVTRGGVYGPGSPAASFEHAETYLRAVLAFMGIAQPEVIVAEGLAVSPETREAATKSALAAISALKAA